MYFERIQTLREMGRVGIENFIGRSLCLLLPTIHVNLIPYLYRYRLLSYVREYCRVLNLGELLS
jgi:hypothetical protein